MTTKKTAAEPAKLKKLYNKYRAAIAQGDRTSSSAARREYYEEAQSYLRMYWSAGGKKND